MVLEARETKNMTLASVGFVTKSFIKHFCDVSKLFRVSPYTQ